MEEILDIVDENDLVIRTCEKKRAHREDLRHRSVHIFIFTDDRRLVVQHRSRRKTSYPLHLTFSAAGHVTSGGSYHDAAMRELEEELGITTPLTEVGKFYRHNPGIENEWYTVYAGRHNGPFSNWEEEAENLLFFTLDELHHLTSQQPQLFEDCFLIDLQHYLQAQK